MPKLYKQEMKMYETQLATKLGPVSLAGSQRSHQESQSFDPGESLSRRRFARRTCGARLNVSLSLEPDKSLSLEPDESLSLEPDESLSLESDESLSLERRALRALRPLRGRRFAPRACGAR